MGKRFRLSTGRRTFTEWNVERSFKFKRNWWHLCRGKIDGDHGVDAIQRWMMHAKPGQSRALKGTLFIYLICVS